ncbi:hypothetical protein DFJ58DRAFT_349103 [Suillus subalutaceus]|uniref:uncharacterized protein n=1 Tax=Suillus subalutaceus TaxID=48586 RepID=UPI001B864BC3|nr:uncharacterized protein DFJ58DRAFT_349103 [Suillus subalutaceus]KAG1855712.1 hypothetical protein DFJ58DRAFT_349103 [Suillus subalutaceus]
MGDAPSHNAPQQARSCSSHCIAPSTLVIRDTMPSLLAVSRGLLLLSIYICNIESIVILRLVINAHTVGAFVVLAAVSSVFALLVFPVTLCYKRQAEAEVSNTRYLIAFSALCLLDLPSCITLPFRAHQNNATALCQDLSQSGGCTVANVLIGCYYTSVILAIIGFVITYIDRRSGIPKVSPPYPNAQAASSHFTFQYPQDVESRNMPTELPTGKAKQAHADERWTEIPL